MAFDGQVEPGVGRVEYSSPAPVARRSTVTCARRHSRGCGRARSRRSCGGNVVAIAHAFYALFDGSPEAQVVGEQLAQHLPPSGVDGLFGPWSSSAASSLPRNETTSSNVALADAKAPVLGASIMRRSPVCYGPRPGRPR